MNVEERDGVAVVWLDNGRANVLDLELLVEFTETMRRLADGPAVVLTGTGTVFSGGVDLRRVVAGGPEYLCEFLPALSAAFLAVFDHPRPVVAAVNGHAIAGGCIIAAASDLRLMSGGTIGLTELLVGVPFPTAALEIMRFAVGPAVSTLALTGRTVTPEEARGIGLVHAVVPDGLLDRAVRQAEELARLPRVAYALTKEQLRRPARRRIDELAPVDDARVARMWQAEDGLAAIAGYLDRLGRRREG
jgi:enoyl-CoA hydratase/carnithine racemase